MPFEIGAELESEIEDDPALPLRIKLDPRRQVSAQVYEALKKAIVSLQLPPGSSISENRICRHIGVSRRGLDKGPIDEALQRLGLEREIVTMVGGFLAALALARTSDLIASVPERHTGNLRVGMHSFPLPVTMPEVTVSLLWHPRMDADPAHRWLRGCVRDVCVGRALAVPN